MTQDLGPIRDIWVAQCQREHVYAETAVRVSAPDCFFTHPVLSPDGARVAFWGGEGSSVDVWIADVRTKRVERITGDAGISGHPSWSPDSRQIVFFHNPLKGPGPYFPPWGPNEANYGPRDLWIMDIETRERRQVTDEARDNERPAWSPDGERIAYVAGEGDSRNLWILDLAGGSPMQITHTEGVFYRPAWHPDGTRLAFNNKGPGDHYLWTLGLGGNDLWRVTSPAPDGGVVHDHGAFWSRDGQEILFHSDRGGRWGLWIVGADGGGLRPIPLPGLPPASHASWDREETIISFDAPRG